MRTPILFTHSYFSGTGAEMNPAADYISAAIVRPGGTFSEFVEVDGDRYVFSFWLDFNNAVLVKPSSAVIDAWRERHGGLLTAFMPCVCHGNEIARMQACMRETSSRSGFSWDALAGDVLCTDLIDHIVSLIGEEYRAAVALHIANRKSR